MTNRLCTVYDVGTKAQSFRLEELKPKKVSLVRSSMNDLLTVFFVYNGIVRYELLLEGRTVNKEYYFKVLQCLREAIRRKCPDLWKNNLWLWHHDSTSAHTSLLVCDFLAEKKTRNYASVTIFTGLDSLRPFLFSKVKRPIKGQRFATIDEIKTEFSEELKAIQKNAYQKCFKDWKKRWHKCSLYSRVIILKWKKRY